MATVCIKKEFLVVPVVGSHSFPSRRARLPTKLVCPPLCLLQQWLREAHCGSQSQPVVCHLNHTHTTAGWEVLLCHTNRVSCGRVQEGAKKCKRVGKGGVGCGEVQGSVEGCERSCVEVCQHERMRTDA